MVLDDLRSRAGRVLGRNRTVCQRRHAIIRESLYGVDVMGWAVHVAELRLWLQLVMETEVLAPELKFKPLLPNPSFKVREAVGRQLGWSHTPGAGPSLDTGRRGASIHRPR